MKYSNKDLQPKWQYYEIANKMNAKIEIQT